jgi:hypothetical protein
MVHSRVRKQIATSMPTTLVDRISEFAAWLRSDKFPLPTIAAIPASKCSPEGIAGREIERDRAYFSVEVKELFLAEGRRWWVEYSPAVLMIVEFIYGNQKISVPTLVGPNTIRQKNGQCPQGVVLENTLVAGPYPFRGGRVAITTILYRAQHHNYARSLLNFSESVSSAIGVPADLGTLMKIGSTVLDGLQTLLQLGDAEPLAAHRIEFEGGSLQGFRSSFCALIAGGADPTLVRVEDGGRLKIELENGQTIRFEQADYMLYSVNRRDRRGEISTLPFATLLDQARSAALSPEDTGWIRAKASLSTLCQQLVLSPDLTPEEADEIMDSFKAELLKLKEKREKLALLSPKEIGKVLSPTAIRLAKSVSFMNL